MSAEAAPVGVAAQLTWLHSRSPPTLQLERLRHGDPAAAPASSIAQTRRHRSLVAHLPSAQSVDDESRGGGGAFGPRDASTTLTSVEAAPSPLITVASASRVAVPFMAAPKLATAPLNSAPHAAASSSSPLAAPVGAKLLDTYQAQLAQLQQLLAAQLGTAAVVGNTTQPPSAATLFASSSPPAALSRSFHGDLHAESPSFAPLVTAATSSALSVSTIAPFSGASPLPIGVAPPSFFAPPSPAPQMTSATFAPMLVARGAAAAASSLPQHAASSPTFNQQPRPIALQPSAPPLQLHNHFHQMPPSHFHPVLPNLPHALLQQQQHFLFGSTSPSPCSSLVDFSDAEPLSPLPPRSNPVVRERATIFGLKQAKILGWQKLRRQRGQKWRLEFCDRSLAERLDGCAHPRRGT